jgi:hypothetical protein
MSVRRFALSIFSDFDGDRLAPPACQVAPATKMLGELVAWTEAMRSVRQPTK